MSSSAHQFNASAQVERIRDILVGRQLGDVEQRLARLESANAQLGYLPQPTTAPAEAAATTTGDDFSAPADSVAPAAAPPRPDASLHARISALTEQNERLQQQITAEISLRQTQARDFAAALKNIEQMIEGQPAGDSAAVNQEMNYRLEAATSQMASHIDDRLRDILQHLQRDILDWRSEFHRELQGLRDTKVDHNLLRQRLEMLASAAMAEEPKAEPPEGFLL